MTVLLISSILFAIVYAMPYNPYGVDRTSVDQENRSENTEGRVGFPQNPFLNNVTGLGNGGFEGRQNPFQNNATRGANGGFVVPRNPFNGQNNSTRSNGFGNDSERFGANGSGVSGGMGGRFPGVGNGVAPMQNASEIQRPTFAGNSAFGNGLPVSTGDSGSSFGRRSEGSEGFRRQEGTGYSN